MSLTLIIVLITALISIAAFNNAELKGKLIMNAYLVHHNKQWYRMFSHGFIHADWMHLIFNMLALYSFGLIVENNYQYHFEIGRGTFYYALLYFGALLIASVPDLAKHKDQHWFNSLGASGAVSAVVFAAILFDPWVGITIFPIPFPIPGIVFGPLFLLFSQYMAKRGGDNIGHEAHFYGALTGILLTIIYKPSLAVDFAEKVKSHF
ncbi:MAG: rhomboid family intramembrane serine protease [Bacteroidia bacterium]